MRLHGWLLLVLPLFLLAAESQPATTGMAAARSRVLIERMARIYAWRLLEPDSAEAKLASQKTSQLFDAQVRQLANQDQLSTILRDNYALLNQQWTDYRVQIASKPSKENAGQVLETSEDMGWIAQKGNDLMQKEKRGEIRSVQLAENIAALSQRLAKIYLMETAGLKVPFLKKDLISARTEFEYSTRELKALPGNTTSLNSQISVMDVSWFFFQHAIDDLAEHGNDPVKQHDVISSSEHIYDIAEELAERYRRHAVN